MKDAGSAVNKIKSKLQTNLKRYCLSILRALITLPSLPVLSFNSSILEDTILKEPHKTQEKNQKIEYILSL